PSVAGSRRRARRCAGPTSAGSRRRPRQLPHAVVDASIRHATSFRMIVGLGIDAIDIALIERMIEGKKDRVLRRLFSEGELRYVDSKIAPAQHIAVRLAAKEAAYKALAGNELARGIGWRDV